VHRQVADRLTESGGRLVEERRLVTALFADISGFTSLADRLDPEQLVEVIDPIISRLSSVVGRYEGYVDKFAGDALLAFFGAPVSHEDDAVRAILVALDMHREMRAMLSHLRPDVRDLTLHVGINTGHVIARVLGSDVRLDYSVLGDAVILAQRLESVAPGGATYLGEATYRLARDRFVFEPVGELTLKGKAHPVPAWRLIGEASHPVDRAASSSRTLGFVGRSSELESLTQRLQSLHRGDGGAVVVTGEPGIGKSRLTEAMRQAALGRGVRWLDARCLSYGAALAYWPYADLMRRFFGIRREASPEDGREQLAAGLGSRSLGPIAPLIAQLMGLSSSGGEGLEPEALQRRIHGAVVELLVALANDVPTVLCLEDAHWIDSASAALTAEIARTSTSRSRFLLMVNTRPQGYPAVEEMIRSIPDHARLRIDLTPMDQASIGALVEAMLDAPPDQQLVSVLADRAAGNPFFAEEVVRSLLQTGSLVKRAGRFGLEPTWSSDTVPETVEGVIAARIDSLPPTQSTVLQVAAIIGRRVRRGLLKAVALDVADVDLAVERLIDGGFLDREPEVDSVVFHHALTLEVAYGRPLRRRRRELHQRIGEAAEALYGAGDDVIDLLARHFYLGEGGAKALQYLGSAAQRAKRLFANPEAILHLRHAEEVVRDRPEFGDQLPAIMLDQAELLERVGNFAEAFRVYNEVRQQTGDVNGWGGMASTLRKQGKYAEALTLLELAAAAVKGSDLRLVWLERSWCLNVAGRVAEAASAARTGLQSAPESRDKIAGYLLLQLVRANSIEGRLDEAIEQSSQARRLFEENADLVGLAMVMRAVGGAYNSAGRLDEAAEALRHGLGLAERIGNAEEIGGCLINLGFAELLRGNLDEAIAIDLRAIEEFERIGHGSGRATAYANLAEMLARKGEYREAERRCDQALGLAQAIGHEWTIADVASTRALIALGREDFREAASQAQLAAGLFRRMGAAPQAASAQEMAASAREKAEMKETAAQVGGGLSAGDGG
jgi:class 3 adenylate cyclase/tetratricopeptide (TPR) repeat protein